MKKINYEKALKKIPTKKLPKFRLILGIKGYFHAKKDRIWVEEGEFKSTYIQEILNTFKSNSYELWRITQDVTSDLILDIDKKKERLASLAEEIKELEPNTVPVSNGPNDIREARKHAGTYKLLLKQYLELSGEYKALLIEFEIKYTKTKQALLEGRAKLESLLWKYISLGKRRIPEFEAGKIIVEIDERAEKIVERLTYQLKEATGFEY